MTNLFVAVDQISGEFASLERRASWSEGDGGAAAAADPFVDDLQLLSNVNHFALVLQGVGLVLLAFADGAVGECRRFGQAVFRIVQLQLGGLASLLALQGTVGGVMLISCGKAYAVEQRTEFVDFRVEET